MRVILLSDLHIKPNSNADNLSWVEHFCDFMNKKYYPDTIIIVLGDVIDKGCQNKHSAFDAADKIFSYITKKLHSIHYQITFIPGNHDYCDGKLDEFMWFCRKRQNLGETIFDFSQKKAWEYTIGNINFIFVDSIQNGDFSIPGSLNLDSIRSCLKTDKKNVILMHHSLMLEDSGKHTGIVNQSETFEFIQSSNIEFVFHGHTHATRHIDNCCKLFGVGSIGLDESDLKGLPNEQDQFLEVIINKHCIESITNWLWRGGSKKYDKILLYPENNNQYESGEHIPRKEYSAPKDHMPRHVMPRDLALADALTRCINAENETTLFEACKKNVHVLFIADAGLGKTFEMEYLAYTVSEKDRYLRPVFLSLKNYNSQTIQTYIETIIPEYKTIDPDQFFLIMDGYDELAKPNDFKRELLQYLQNNPNTHICISMRSNFLSSNSSAFHSFSVFQLLELNDSDIQRELQKSNIDEDIFREECKNKKLINLIRNPFYLRNLITIYLSDKSLPNQSKLMDRLIDKQFSIDAAKFEYALQTPLEDCRYEAECALIRFAYGMQLLNTSVLNEEIYQIILSEKDRWYVKCSSLTRNHYGHSFSHNIFREYLIAKYLSKTNYANIIQHISIPGTKHLNPNWFNILGFILKLNSCDELKEWIVADEPLILTGIEPDRADNELRYFILESTLSSIVSKNIWFRNEICSESHLASFSQSSSAVDLLINHIKAPSHFRSLYFCISVLSNFSDLYGKDERVRQTLIDCYQNDEVRAHEKRVAISAIAMLNLSTPEITEDLVTRFNTSKSSFERLGVYEYLLQIGKINENVNFLLSGIKHISYSYDNDEVCNATEHYTLMDCLRNIDEPNAIDRIISWFSYEENMNIDFYDKDKLFSGLFDKAVDRYNEGYHSLFETVYELFVNTNRNYSRYHIPDVLRFFICTGTMKTAFTRIVCEDANDCVFMVDDAIREQPDLIDLFCQLYIENKLHNPDSLKQFALRWHHNESLFQKCAAAIYQKTGEVLVPPPVPVDFNQQRKNDTQAFFNRLFDKEALRNLIIEIVNFFDNPDMTCEQLYSLHIWRKNLLAGTKSLIVALKQNGFKDERIIDIIDLIDWDKFFISRICYLFEIEKGMSFLVISNEQKKILIDIYHQLEEKLDLHAAIEEIKKDSYCFSSDVQYYMILKNVLELQSPNSYYLGLLEIPYHFINKISNVEEKYKYIEKYILPGDIIERIAFLVPKETRVCILDELMFGCRRYRIKSCKDTAIKMCKMNTIDAYNRRNALEYLLDIFGNDLILKEIMPIADNSFFELIINKLRSDKDERLKSEMLNRYKKSPSNFLIKELIELNVQEGLCAYIDASRKAGCIMDITYDINEVTKAISSVHDITLLPQLVDAVRLLFTDGFIDGSFYSLYGSLQTALAACAKSDFNIVWKALEDLKTELSSNLEAISFFSV